MGLDPIQHQLTLSIVCAVQASGCFLISRAVAKLRSDWQRPMAGSTPLVQNRLIQDRLIQDLASIEPQAHHQFDLQAWDQQFAQVLDSTPDQVAEGVGAGLQDPWDEGEEAELPVEELPVEELPVKELPVKELPVEKLQVRELAVEKLLVEESPVEESPMPSLDSHPIEPIALNTLFALTVPQLRSQAKQLGLKNYSRQTKAQLLVAIRRQIEGMA
jgi:Rho termination factor, N-terminal domain